jgi:Icc-related predicted phosphoesterase
MPVRPPWPAGTVNADGRIVEAAGLRVAGVGGSPRYKRGPNQYSEAQQRRRVKRLLWKAHRLRRRRETVDLVIAHSPIERVGDGDDMAHRGFECLHRLVSELNPALFLHGHVRPTGGATDHWIGTTRVVNVFGHRLLEVDLARSPS